MEQVSLDINVKKIQVSIEKNWTLLFVLREVLGLTGAKCGCSTGDCGACKVIIDGEAVNSCLVLARNLEGKKIETIEGLSNGTELHPGVYRRRGSTMRILHAGNGDVSQGASGPD